MHFVIFEKNKKPVLGLYYYNWAANTFVVTLGSTSHSDSYIDELPYKVLADLSYKVESSSSGFLCSKKYPENNVLEVKPSNENFTLTPDQIFKLRGFKKFFKDKNVTSVKIVDVKPNNC